MGAIKGDTRRLDSSSMAFLMFEEVILARSHVFA